MWSLYDHAFVITLSNGFELVFFFSKMGPLKNVITLSGLDCKWNHLFIFFSWQGRPCLQIPTKWRNLFFPYWIIGKKARITIIWRLVGEKDLVPILQSFIWQVNRLKRQIIVFYRIGPYYIILVHTSVVHPIPHLPRVANGTTLKNRIFTVFCQKQKYWPLCLV